MKRVSFLPNILTAFALSCGLFVIFKMNMQIPGATTYHHVLQATCILILAAFLDLLDGAIARVMQVESEFGGVFDCLADAISFGVAPSVVILKALSFEKSDVLSFVLTLSAMIYSISGVLRLVRFAVTSHQIQGNEEKMALAKANFTGLPIPAGAAIVVSTTLFLMSDECKELYSFSENMRAIIAALVFIFVGYFMISRWKFPSLKTLQIRVGSFRVVLITCLIAVAILLGAVQHFPVVLVSLSWFYVIFALLLSIVRIISGRKLHALEDFEPEPEDEKEDL